MTARRSAATAVIAALLAAFPAAAQASPVSTSRAVLTEHEMPAGSSGYTVRTATARVPSATVPDTACDRAGRRADVALAGSTGTEATARRAGDTLRVEVSDRPGVAVARDVITSCNADPGVVPASEVAPPPDLARMAPSVTRTRDGRLLQSVVDVRGMSIAVSVTGSQKPADSATFWQLLRTQITKVEKAR